MKFFGVVLRAFVRLFPAEPRFSALILCKKMMIINNIK